MMPWLGGKFRERLLDTREFGLIISPGFSVSYAKDYQSKQEMEISG